MKFLFTALLPVLLIGCATLTKGTSDTLHLNVTNCSEQMACTASNKKGSWNFTAPGSVKFKKSDTDLHISCKDKDDLLTITATPNRGSMGWGNIIFGGLIGAGVDSSTDAHWDMVDTISIARKTCYGEVIKN